MIITLNSNMQHGKHVRRDEKSYVLKLTNNNNNSKNWINCDFSRIAPKKKRLSVSANSLK